MFTNCSLKEKRKLDKVIFTNLQFQRKSKPFAHNQAKILNVLAKQTLMSFKHLSLSFHECLKRLMEKEKPAADITDGWSNLNESFRFKAQKLVLLPSVSYFC